MNKTILAVAFSAVAVAVCCAFVWPSKPTPQTVEMKWYTWEEAVALNQTAPKKIFVDVYTDWCGWCKKMDKSTFVDPQVAAYMSKHFYPVKLNAEQKGDIVFNGTTFQYVSNGGRGYHALAYSLLEGQLGYPSFVYLNEKYERIMVSPGFKDPATIMKELTFAAEEQYSKTTWEEWNKQ